MTPSAARVAESVKLRWPRLPPALGFITGMIDVISWITLAHFYTANITGDLVQSVSYIIPGQSVHVLQVLAAPVFLIGVIFVYVVARRLGASSPAMMRTLLLIQAAVLAVLCVAAGSDGVARVGKNVSDLIVGLLAVFAIALSNTTMHMMDKSAPTTWALTANCVSAAIASLNLITGHGSEDQRRQDRHTWHTIWPTVLAFLMGSLVGVEAVQHFQERAWLVPLISALLLWTLLWPRATERAIAVGSSDNGT